MCSWTNIRRTEAADRAAKEAFEKEPTVDLMSFLDLKPFTAKYIHQVWQKEWDEAVIVSNELLEMLPKLSDKLYIILQGKERRRSSKQTTYWSFLFDSFHSFEKQKRLLLVLHVILLSQSNVS